MVEELILAGADIIKVGIGPGNHSISPECTMIFLNVFGQVFSHCILLQDLCVLPAKRQELDIHNLVL